jgi:hypothetical protein
MTSWRLTCAWSRMGRRDSLFFRRPCFCLTPKLSTVVAQLFVAVGARTGVRLATDHRRNGGVGPEPAPLFCAGTSSSLARLLPRLEHPPPREMLRFIGLEKPRTPRRGFSFRFLLAETKAFECIIRASRTAIPIPQKLRAVLERRSQSAHEKPRRASGAFLVRPRASTRRPF